MSVTSTLEPSALPLPPPRTKLTRSSLSPHLPTHRRSLASASLLLLININIAHSHHLIAENLCKASARREALLVIRKRGSFTRSTYLGILEVGEGRVG